MTVERKVDIMKMYNATAHLYNMRYEHEQKLKISFLLNKLRPKEDEILLDIGCGTGILFNMVNCKTMIGLDISINMLREVKNRGKIDLILADGEHLPIKDESIDIITSVTVLNLIMDKKRFLSEIMRCLKRGGKFGISLLNREEPPIVEGVETYEIETMKEIFIFGKK
ncbi:MAG: methyltransferase domain-containing protein [Candidatus Methanomethyliaceae archaeon]|nr:methyltransferase domain-containing protein [Candidatus Methanomethyliaceae archaeon]MCX8169802.1 methyltransferase domain-containing protein [Candidatus Methanomethyliaceae archaeon]MDW7970946.1 methyltransferase domain-containing protein [Nitrososphaerota archaeon]